MEEHRLEDVSEASVVQLCEPCPLKCPPCNSHKALFASGDDRTCSPLRSLWPVDVSGMAYTVLISVSLCGGGNVGSHCLLERHRFVDLRAKSPGMGILPTRAPLEYRNLFAHIVCF